MQNQNTGKLMSKSLKLITADEAYGDKEGKLREETGINLVRPADSKVLLPSNVDEETMNVTLVLQSQDSI
ncbi:hypothetical protein QUF75_18145 [Desulfococcaceae bacterium HSG7]|nr:hypothetical protein [Desulfococcaceae bacterium HSG7]